MPQVYGLIRSGGGDLVVTAAGPDGMLTPIWSTPAEPGAVAVPGSPDGPALHGGHVLSLRLPGPRFVQWHDEAVTVPGPPATGRVLTERATAHPDGTVTAIEGLGLRAGPSTQDILWHWVSGKWSASPLPAGFRCRDVAIDGEDGYAAGDDQRGPALLAFGGAGVREIDVGERRVLDRGGASIALVRALSPHLVVVGRSWQTDDVADSAVLVRSGDVWRGHVFRRAEVFGVVRHGGDVLAVAYGGDAWRSADSGRTWRPASLRDGLARAWPAPSAPYVTAVAEAVGTLVIVATDGERTGIAVNHGPSFTVHLAEDDAVVIDAAVIDAMPPR
ncbi:MAG TPA: hypothetical protein VNA20_10425 [Frankiaceae bacterium]|nr:hypothetical protein [Frankiaceae bacterium]